MTENVKIVPPIPAQRSTEVMNKIDERLEEQDRLDFFHAVQSVYQEAGALLLRKHRDYGPRNIADAPGGALNGLRVRMHDKLARINNLIGKERDPENESLRDSFMDIANYGLIAVLVLDEQWPGA